MLNSSSITGIAHNIKKQNFLVKVLINSVGIVPVGSLLDVKESAWQEAFQVSFMGCVNFIRNFSPLMKIHGGSIVIINGVLAIQPDPSLVVSAAVTGALRNFAKAISKDLIQYGIRVNSILPGATQTPLLENIASQLSLINKSTSKKIISNIVASNPLGRLATPKDIAHTTNFLCSKFASYINGAFIAVDGGAVDGM
jgi:NAD(P)-dependent dehydrogenase (short-subunit alcohol dehydrogenase family)